MRPVVAPVVLAVLAGVTLPAAPASSPQEPTLATVLERAAAYVATFQQRLSRMVAEERYIQEWYSGRATGTIQCDGCRSAALRVAPRFERRELRSDLVLMQVGGNTSWTEFRDVFEVDGRAIRPRTGRLEQLLSGPTGAASAGVSSILKESARFNLGDIDRNVNTPLFSLRFLERGNQPRFRFSRRPHADPGAAASPATPDDNVFRVSTEVWVIAYDEVQKPTIMRAAARKNQPAHGRFWIEPDTGRVLASELIVDDRYVRATIEVSFQSEPLLEMLVPAAMRERYDGKKSKSRIEGAANYSTFRTLDPTHEPSRGHP